MKKNNMNENGLFPEVLQAVAGDDFTVYAYMNDGTVRLLDMKPLIERGNLFEKLRNRDFFESVTVMNNTVAWDLSGKRDPYNCIDIDPFTVWECQEVPDPLADRGKR